MTRRPLVDVIVIGAMKCGTTSLHHYLDAHPQIGLPAGKEVDFFFGATPGGPGNLWRGTAWYDARFPPGAAVRVEVSPGYTSPDHPDVAARIAELAPAARLVYLARDPLERAVSQYRHHRRDGTEPRSLADALLDPASHYLRRSCHAARVAPFVERFDPSAIAVVDHADLAERTEATVAAVCDFVGVEPAVPASALRRRHNAAATPRPSLPPDLVAAFRAAVADDAARFTELRRGLVDLSATLVPR